MLKNSEVLQKNGYILNSLFLIEVHINSFQLPLQNKIVNVDSRILSFMSLCYLCKLDCIAMNSLVL